MGSEAADDYCHYASLFIGKIWMDSVRKILDKEAGNFESRKLSFSKFSSFGFAIICANSSPEHRASVSQRQCIRFSGISVPQMVRRWTDLSDGSTVCGGVRRRAAMSGGLRRRRAACGGSVRRSVEVCGGVRRRAAACDGVRRRAAPRDGVVRRRTAACGGVRRRSKVTVL